MQKTPLEQLVAAISDPRICEEASTLIKLSTVAVDDLSQLDERIYRHLDEDAATLSDATTAAPTLEALATDILKGVRALEAHLQEHAQQPEASSEADDDGDGDLEFDFDFATGVEAEPGPEPEGEPEATVEEEDFGDSFGDDFTGVNSLRGFDDFKGFDEELSDGEEGGSIADLDLEGAFDMLGDAEPEKSCLERWRSLLGELESFAYALGSQIRDFDERFVDALRDGRFEQALRELNDVGRSVTDGVFALMTAIYEAYLNDVDRDGVLPGHKSTLSRALAGRRGLTDLRRRIHAANTVLQSDIGGEAPQEVAFDDIVFCLAKFVAGEVFTVMRPADRIELANFLREITGKTRVSGRFDCEGLDKYLDSLAAVSQRDVLIKHDGDLKHDIQEILEAVKPLLEISPHGALDMIGQAFANAEALYGVRDGLDALLADWRAMSDEARANPTEAAAMSQELDARLRELPT